MVDVTALMGSIRAGEDTELELKEVLFRGNRVSFARGEGRAAARLAEVFVSMANTNGGRVVLGVRDSDRLPVGIEPDRRELVEQLAVNAATENCVPMIVPVLNWEYLPGADDEPALCLIVEVPRSPHELHQTSDGRFLQRIGSHRRLIPAERLARLLSARRMSEPHRGAARCSAARWRICTTCGCSGTSATGFRIGPEPEDWDAHPAAPTSSLPPPTAA